MAQIKLLSIKRTEEASYFYDENVATTLDSNRNEVTEVQEKNTDPQISKKARKDEERKSKKEQNQKMKELKKREKEKKKSLKNSKKEIVGSVDTGPPRDDAENKANGDVTSSHLVNPGFQDGMEVDEAAKNDESLKGHEEDSSEHEGAREEHDVTTQGHEQALNEHEESAHDNVEFQGHESSSALHENLGEGHATSSEEHANLELNNGNRAQITTEVEETITVEGVQHTEEAPPDILYQPKVIHENSEPAGGQHIEIEISDVTDLEADASESVGMVVVQNSTQASTAQNSGGSEVQVTAVTVEEVESGVNLDNLFNECYGPGDDIDQEENRKSVRFQEETEEIGDAEHETEDHEHASLNLGGDFSGTSENESVEPTQALQPAAEIVSKEQRNEVKSCEVDLDTIFTLSKGASNDTEKVPNDAEQNVAIGDVKVHGSAKTNGKSTVGNGRTKIDDLEEIDLNESNAQKNTAAKKKEKRKKSGLMRCCFP